ncbi:glutamate racemase [Candidatus Microgenomates bacterium]|nr:glutamate racemase [Candidatus Microgenomates bacterium]
MNNQPIGILDSGVGGLTIWREIVRKLPHESTIYIADSKNCPYGSKTSQEIYQLARRLVQFLIENNCKLIVLACNTITVSCLDRLRKDFPHVPIVGTVPVVRTASKLSKNKKIGILSTTRTAESQYQKDLIQNFAGDCELINIGTDKLVPLIEKGNMQDKMIQIILHKELKPFVNYGIDTLALGCSHFPLIKGQIQKELSSKVLVLDSGTAIARQVQRVLQGRNQLSTSGAINYIFYTTGNKAQFSEILRSMEYNNEVKQVDL